MNVIAMNKFHEKLEDKKLLSLEDIRELPDCDTKNVRITARRYEKILILLGNAQERFKESQQDMPEQICSFFQKVQVTMMKTKLGLKKYKVDLNLVANPTDSGSDEEVCRLS